MPSATSYTAGCSASTFGAAPVMPVQYEQAPQPAGVTYEQQQQQQAGYYQMGGMQTATMQPQVNYGTTAPGMQSMMFEQQPAAQPCMGMTMPGGEQMMTVPAGATMESTVGVPQQTEAVATPVMERPAVLTSKKARKKLATKKREKACC